MSMPIRWWICARDTPTDCSTIARSDGAFGRQGQLGVAGQPGPTAPRRDRSLPAAGSRPVPGALDQVQDMPPHAAAQVMRDHQDGRQVRAPEQLHGHRETERAGGTEFTCWPPSRVARIVFAQ